MISSLRASRLLAAALVALMLSACVAVAPAVESAPPTAATEAPPEEATSEVSTESAVFPVTFEHKFGTTTVESEPQRVVALGFTDQDPILALGVVPVAVRYFFGPAGDQVWPWADAALGDATTEVLNIPFGEMNFEQIAGLNPDLIVAVSAGLSQAEYETLDQIAPTLPQTSEFVDFGVPWQDQTRIIGKALGKSAEAEQLVQETEAKFASAREEHPEFVGATAAIASPADGGNIFFSGPQHERQRFLTSLGFVLPESLVEAAGDAFYGTLSREQIAQLDTDVLLWTVTPDQAAEIQDDPLYQTLHVAQEGRDLFLDSTGTGDMAAPAIIYSSVLSLPYAFDLLVPQLAEKMAQE